MLVVCESRANRALTQVRPIDALHLTRIMMLPCLAAICLPFEAPLVKAGSEDNSNEGEECLGLRAGG